MVEKEEPAPSNPGGFFFARLQMLQSRQKYDS